MSVGPSAASEPSKWHADKHFLVEPAAACHVPGYVIVIPRVPVTTLAEMSAAALTALGPVLARTTRAIETMVRPERIYCALFAESERRVHFHLLPRTAWLAAQYAAAYPEAASISGPLLFDWARRTFNQPIPGQNREEVNDSIRRLLAAEIA